MTGVSGVPQDRSAPAQTAYGLLRRSQTERASMTDTSRTSDPLTQREQAIAEALYADTWTDPKPAYGDEWHHRFPWWMCIRAARIVATMEDAPIVDLEGPASFVGDAVVMYRNEDGTFEVLAHPPVIAISPETVKHPPHYCEVDGNGFMIHAANGTFRYRLFDLDPITGRYTAHYMGTAEDGRNADLGWDLYKDELR